MKPAPFRYLAPESVAEAAAILTEHGDDAKVLAGGQSLVPVMNMRLARPSVLVDVCANDALTREITMDGALAIGAGTRQAAALRHPLVRDHAPLMAAALRQVGHAANRNWGTVGGSIAHADPAAELPAVLLALDGEVVVQGPAGQRTVQAGDLFVTYFSTALGLDEVLTEVRLPLGVPNGRRTWGFAEVARRHGDFALTGVAMTADVATDGAVVAARIALFGVSDTPVRATAAERALIGGRLDDTEHLRECAALAADGVDPPDDVHASGAYRKDAVVALVRRAAEHANRQLEGSV